jgi:hypothetical protein
MSPSFGTVVLASALVAFHGVYGANSQMAPNRSAMTNSMVPSAYEKSLAAANCSSVSQGLRRLNSRHPISRQRMQHRTTPAGKHYRDSGR